MDKQRQQNLLKRYISFFAFCLIILLIGVIASIPIKMEVHSVGEKPSFVFSFLVSAMSLAAAVVSSYSTYMCWFQADKARLNIKHSIEELAKQYFIYRLPLYNPTFIFWFIRIISPIIAILLFGLFLLMLLSGF